MSTEKEKSFWDLKATTSFIIACLEQVVKGEQLGTSFTKKGQIGIVSKFKELIGKFYDKSEFKNKFGNLRRKWLVWYRLLGKETGLRWDNVKNIVDAIDEWWKRKQLESLRFVFSVKNVHYCKFEICVQCSYTMINCECVGKTSIWQILEQGTFICSQVDHTF